MLIRSKLHLNKEAPVEVKHVVAFGLVNKIERQSSDHYRAFKHKVDAILQKGFLDLSSRSGCEELYGRWRLAKIYLFQKSQKARLNSMGSESPVETEHRLVK